ncbi:MAG: GTPase RsgA [Blautia faecis]
MTAILPQPQNSLIRPAVANVDQALVIFAMDESKPNFMLLDRFRIMMEQQKVFRQSSASIKKMWQRTNRRW